jgi:hypothetical protein
MCCIERLEILPKTCLATPNQLEFQCFATTPQARN